MSSKPKDNKIYGAVESKSHISFSGFCKKIFSNEQQSVDIYLDDIKIDSILANSQIEDIENKYEVFDTNNFCFKYDLPLKYLESSHKIEFKNQDGEQLLNSPTFTIDTRDKSSYKPLFIHSLSNWENKVENIENLSISSLLFEDILHDKDFINYLKELQSKIKSLNYKFYIFCFTEDERKYIEKIFDNKKIEVVLIKSIEDIISCTKIFLMPKNNLISKYTDNTGSILLETTKKLGELDFLVLQSNNANKNSNLQETGEKIYKSKESNFESYSKEEKEKYKYNFYLLTIQKFFDENNIKYNLDINMNTNEYLEFERIKLFLTYPSLTNYIIKLTKKA